MDGSAMAYRGDGDPGGPNDGFPGLSSVPATIGTSTSRRSASRCRSSRGARTWAISTRLLLCRISETSAGVSTRTAEGLGDPAGRAGLSAGGAARRRASSISAGGCTCKKVIPAHPTAGTSWTSRTRAAGWPVGYRWILELCDYRLSVRHPAGMGRPLHTGHVPGDGPLPGWRSGRRRTIPVCVTGPWNQGNPPAAGQPSRQHRSCRTAMPMVKICPG